MGKARLEPVRGKQRSFFLSAKKTRKSPGKKIPAANREKSHIQNNSGKTSGLTQTAVFKRSLFSSNGLLTN